MQPSLSLLDLMIPAVSLSSEAASSKTRVIVQRRLLLVKNFQHADPATGILNFENFATICFIKINYYCLNFKQFIRSLLLSRA